jgi:hypothetical protein
LAAAVVASWTALPAPAAAAQSVTLLGASTRPILLDPTASGQLVGELHLALRNSSDKKQLVRFVYSRNQDGLVATLPGTPQAATVTAGPGKLSPDGKAIVITKGSVGQVALRFELASDASPSSLDGVLAVESRTPEAGQSFVQQLTLSVVGTIRPLGDVRFEPSSLGIQATGYCPFVDSCTPESKETVQLVGSDVGELVESLSRAGQTSIVTQLRRGDGSVIYATLSSLALVPDEPGVATADVTVMKSEPGEYTGSLPLSRLVAKPPQLGIELSSRTFWPWCLLCIIAGVWAAAVFTQQIGLSRRRKLIRDALEREAKEYCTDRLLNFPNGAGQPLVWDPKVDCPLKDDPNWSYYEELKTFTAVYSAARWARNDSDLDEAESTGMALIAGLTSWRLMLAQVRALWDLAHQTREEPNHWNKTRVARDTELLLHRVTHTPVDGTVDAALLGKLRQQIGWHGHFAEAWDLRARLILAGGESALAARTVSLEELDKKAGALWARNEDTQDEQDLTLMETFSRLKELQAESNRDLTTGPVHDPEIPVEAALRATAINAELASLGDVAANPAQSLSALGVHLALRPQDGDTHAAAPEEALKSEPTVEEKPSAENDGSAEDGAPAEPARGGAPNAIAEPPSAETPVPAGRGNDKSASLLTRLQRTDLLLSSIVVVLSSIVYSATVYNATWGSLLDWATAFGAGFTGQVVTKWALLPIYRSVRLRATAAKQQAAAA